MATPDDFLPRLTTQAPGIPEPSALSVIVLSAQRLCRDTHVWQETLDPLPVTAGDAEPELEPPADSRVIAVLSVSFEGHLLEPITHGELHRRYGPRWPSLTGAPRSFLCEPPGRLRLVPIPDTTVVEGLTDIRAALEPTAGATTLPDILFDECQDAIVYEALTRLLRMPQRTWTDGALSAYYAQMYRCEMVRVRRQARRDFAHTELRAEVRGLPGAP